MMHAAFWIAVLQIIGVNIILSGDNAVVIAMACMTLPPRQRLWGMILGAGDDLPLSQAGRRRTAVLRCNQAGDRGRRRRRWRRRKCAEPLARGADRRHR